MTSDSRGNGSLVKRHSYVGGLRPKICPPSAVARGGTHTQPPTPIHLCRPPTSRLWASTAAEPRRILTARRLEMWLRLFTWLHLHFSCRCAANLLKNGVPWRPAHASASRSGAVRSLQRCRSRSPPPLHHLIFGPQQSAWICWPCDDDYLRAHASRPTSCSRSSTSGRRSTSRRSALTPRWTPERARLPPPPCQAPARVTVACAYVRSTVATALGRSHAVGAVESGQ